MQIYLYIKTHNITGLKYFGKTTNKDPFKYRGSGKYWKRHIRKYGYDVNTEIFGQYTDELLCSLAALKFSKENNIVNSRLWANLQEENGYDGAPIGHIGHQFTSEEKQKMSSLLKERWEDDNYKNKLINAHKQRHVNNPNLASESVKKSIENQKANSTYEEVKQKRKLGLQNFLGTLTQEEKDKFYAFSRSKKSDEHKRKMSEAHKGVPKTLEHRKSLAIAKQNNKNILIDHNGEQYKIHKDFLDRYNLDRKFLIDLNAAIGTRPTLIKLGLDVKENKGKTKAELGFKFI